MIIPAVLVAVLIGVGIVRIGRLALIILRARFDLAIQCVVIARRIGLAFGFLVFLVVRVLLWRGVLMCRVAMQRMHRARFIVLFGLGLGFLVSRLLDFLPVGALHPWRRARRRVVFHSWRRLMAIGIRYGSAARLHFRIGAAHGPERVGLPD